MSDSESDNDSNDLDSKTELGFLEKSPSWKLESRFFPSKVGSKPAWLALSEDIPNSQDLKCKLCEKQMLFLCQLYAPIEENDTCFHRIIYIFICRSEGCSKSNVGFTVYRSQLARTNKYYPSDPPVEEETWRSDLCAESFKINLCNACGIKSNNRCGRCKKIYYCCKEHQLLDWKFGHKQHCKENCSDKFTGDNKILMFPEYEVIIEPEDECENKNDDQELDESSILQSSKGSLQDLPCDDLTKMAHSEEDKAFVKFCDKIKLAPDQVIRYERHGTPLWCSDNNQSLLYDAIPVCQYCGEKRVFEFQVMPQLLNYLDLEVSETSLDWGTLLIFTCKNSCDSGPNYKVEYLLKQDMA